MSQFEFECGQLRILTSPTGEKSEKNYQGIYRHWYNISIFGPEDLKITFRMNSSSRNKSETLQANWIAAMMAIGAYNSEASLDEPTLEFEKEKQRIKPFLELDSDNSVKVTYNKMSVFEYLKNNSRII